MRRLSINLRIVSAACARARCRECSWLYGRESRSRSLTRRFYNGNIWSRFRRLASQGPQVFRVMRMYRRIGRHSAGIRQVVTYLSARGPEAEVERFVAVSLERNTSSPGYPLSTERIKLRAFGLVFTILSDGTIETIADKKRKRCMRSSIINHNRADVYERASDHPINRSLFSIVTRHVLGICRTMNLYICL